MSIVDTADVSTRSEPTNHDARAGVVAMVPFVLGYAPFALVIGAAVAKSGDPLAGWSGSWLIYGGSAHLAVAALAARRAAGCRGERSADQRPPARLQRLAGAAMARPAPVVPGRRGRPRHRSDLGGSRASRRRRCIRRRPTAVLPGCRRRPRRRLVDTDRGGCGRRRAPRCRRTSRWWFRYAWPPSSVRRCVTPPIGSR